ncbi:hypothetical protein GCM10010384_63860 [Streptomyces djakartensis]|uniref:Uncharacterized protein n=1 Tax=Streptomyces djakartensis TaxID=68193 RepID=A0ABQ3AI52_9ACTN|nr:hypothetical protein GCM10010384_63860 [Streptomyces djakartensis]
MSRQAPTLSPVSPDQALAELLEWSDSGTERVAELTGPPGSGRTGLGGIFAVELHEPAMNPRISKVHGEPLFDDSGFLPALHRSTARRRGSYDPDLFEPGLARPGPGRSPATPCQKRGTQQRTYPKPEETAQPAKVWIGRETVRSVGAPATPSSIRGVPTPDRQSPPIATVISEQLLRSSTLQWRTAPTGSSFYEVSSDPFM